MIKAKVFSDRDIGTFERKLKDIIKINENWAIYGTGNGAELIYAALSNMCLISAIKNIIDRDEILYNKKYFHDIEIKTLSDGCNALDGIIIAAIDNHDIIYKNEDAKFRAVISEIKESHAKGQPVLVGTVSIEKSEKLSKLLEKEGIKVRLKRGKNVV